MEVIELPPRVRSACRKLNLAAIGQCLEPGIAVDLQDAFEVRHMIGRPPGIAIRAVKTNSSRRIGPGPRTVVPHIDPEGSVRRNRVLTTSGRSPNFVG